MSVHLLNSGLRPALHQIIVASKACNLVSSAVSVHRNFSSRSAHINHLQQQSMQSESVGTFNLSAVAHRPDQRFDTIIILIISKMNSKDFQYKSKVH